MGGGRQREENWDNCSRITIRNYFKEKNQLKNYFLSKASLTVPWLSDVPLLGTPTELSASTTTTLVNLACNMLYSK